MADTVKTVDELRIKCLLRNSDNDQTTRTLTVANPKAYGVTEQARMKAFRDKLMKGSLSGVIQPTNWRDADPFNAPYETADVEFSTFTSTEIVRDLDEEPEPLRVTFTPAKLSGYGFVEGENVPVTINVEGTGNFEVGEYNVWGVSNNQNVQFDGMTFRIINGEGGVPSAYSEEGTAVVAIIEVVDAITGNKGTGTLIGDNWSPRVQII